MVEFMADFGWIFGIALFFVGFFASDLRDAATRKRVTAKKNYYDALIECREAFEARDLPQPVAIVVARRDMVRMLSDRNSETVLRATETWKRTSTISHVLDYQGFKVCIIDDLDPSGGKFD